MAAAGRAFVEECRLRDSRQGMTTIPTTSMQGVNDYGNQLTPDGIAAKQHRDAVGGLWEQMGVLQFEFLRSRGLQPGHRLADIGCGCLRGGLHFIDYLDPGRYHGLDINASLIEAGQVEVAERGLTDKAPQLLVDDGFRLHRFGQPFDYMLSVSVFTHLPMNHILRCLVEARKCLKPAGQYYASYFEAPSCVHLAPLAHQPGGVVSHFDQDPYHYSFEEVTWMAAQAGLRARRIGEWNHPRNQMMAVLSLP